MAAEAEAETAVVVAATAVVAAATAVVVAAAAATAAAAAAAATAGAALTIRVDRQAYCASPAMAPLRLSAPSRCVRTQVLR